MDEVSTCDHPTFVDTLEKDEEFEPLIEQPLNSFSFDNYYAACLFHNACNYFSNCDNVQLENVSSWLPHDKHSLSFRVDLKDESEPLMEKPTNSKKCSKKKKEQIFKIGEQVYLDYPLDWSLFEKLKECEHFLFKVVKDYLDGSVEVYNVDKGSLRMDPQYLRPTKIHLGLLDADAWIWMTRSFRSLDKDS